MVAGEGWAPVGENSKQLAAFQVLLDLLLHWFTEGFDTKDLQEAKALLAELG
jgi:hypothetical protein